MTNLSTGERSILVKHINALLQPDFETLMFALNVPNGVIPSGQASQGNHAYPLLQWVESPGGCGMSELLKTLDAIAPPPLNTEIEGKSTKEASRENFQEKLTHDVLLDMVYIPEGTFLMGSPENEEGREDSEGPQHRVAVSAFHMGKYPVTQKEWFIVSTFPQIERALRPEPSIPKGDNLPVNHVSWYNAVEFCKRLSKHTGKDYRLPSEAEWEYACRAGTETAYSFGDSITPEQANFNNNLGKTTPVGNYPANKFGLHDMHGNVKEWCQDVWHDNYEGAPTDGTAWKGSGNSDLRVLRSSSWYDSPEYCRSAFRFNNLPGPLNDLRSLPGAGYLLHSPVLGFRVCCSPPRAL